MPKLNVFSRSFWRAYWVSIRRSPHDSRDRNAAILITGSLLLFVGVYGGYYGWLFWYFLKSRDDRIFLIFAMAIGIGFLLLRWFSERRDQREADQADQAEVDPALQSALAQDAYFLAALLTRANSEKLLKEKQLPAGISVVTRQVQINRLRQRGMWDALPPPVRDLLLLPDGHWSGDHLLSVRKCFEILRCLSWVLCIDPELIPLTQVPVLDFKQPQQLFEKPDTLLTGKCLRLSWDIRPQRNLADQFFSRCYAEGIGRKLYTPENSGADEWATAVNERMRDSNTRDFLAGHQTIAEVSDPDLMYLSWTAFNRYQCLQLIMEMQDGKDQRTKWEALCFPQPTLAQLTPE